MRDHVAQAVGASKSKLARLKVIRDNLAYYWKPAFRDGLLGESVAYALAQMPHLWQDLIYENYGTKPRMLYESTVKSFMERFARIDKTSCGDKGDVVCIHKLEMMKKSCKDHYSDPCWNAYCCLKCTSLQTCSKACAHASAKKKQLRDEARDARIKEAEEKVRREKPTIDYIREVYRRVGVARKLAGVTVQQLFEAQQRFYSHSADDPRQKELESGTGKIDTNTDLPFGYTFAAKDGKRLCAVADLLGCSIDYLLGRTEDPQPAAKWLTGEPWNLGSYAVNIRWSKGCRISLEKMDWDGNQWCQFGEPVEIFEDAEIFSWMELPEEVQHDGT